MSSVRRYEENNNSCRIMDLRQKEVINITDGKRLGFVRDVEINLETGRLEAIILPGVITFLSLFGRHTEIVVEWKSIKKIGEEIILVDI